jgi:predicted enzyme related to lactoylglutathione lyase
MTASIEVTIDAVDADPVASFWEAALGYDRLYEREPYIVLGPPQGDAGPRVVIQRVQSVTSDKTPVHMDLRVDDPDAEVARLQALGASVEWVVDETSSGFIRWTTMADPQGTLFCVCPARKERSSDDRDS